MRTSGAEQPPLLDLEIKRERLLERKKQYDTMTQRLTERKLRLREEKGRAVDMAAFRRRLEEHDEMIARRNAILAFNRRVKQKSARCLVQRKYGSVWGRFRL